ncbi:MAG TPA: protein-tyrosine-phosphatase [Janthinobacterium sp.]|nr:protein-tyrosine-phosphatase [Janthinobacterium sp.]
MKRLSAPPLALTFALTLALAFGLAFRLPASAAPPTARNPDWATPVDTAANLYSVTPTFYRSARLRPGDVARLRTLGVKTVVSLRAFHTDAALLERSGIKIVRIPIYTWSIKDKQVVEALRAIRTAQRDGPVLLHCQHGADRTGLITAMYRMLYEQRSKEQAIDELKNGGYGYHAIWKNIEVYLRQVDVAAIGRQVDQV